MGADNGFYLALLAMACASYACRVAGFLLMGYVTITPRLEAALRAIPLGVMTGIVTPAATSGRVPELAGLVAVVRDGSGNRIALHRTYLADDGSAKAPVDNPRKMLASIAGGAVRLAI